MAAYLLYDSYCLCLTLVPGPLDGIPVAVKTTVCIRGYHKTSGTCYRAAKYGVTTEDAVSVARLRAAGESA